MKKETLEIEILEKEDFIIEMTNYNYKYEDIVEFADEHLQNLKTLEENIKEFKKWIGEDKIIKVSVDWDTDDQDIDLPEIVEIPFNIPEEEIADWLSDKYGWCVNCFVVNEDIFKCKSCGMKYFHSFCATNDVSVCRWCSGEEK